MKVLQLPRFQSYEEEAAFWDNLDTTDHMEDDGEWFRFEVAQPRGVRVTILAELAQQISEKARGQGVSLETLVNVWLSERIHEPAQ